MTRTAKYAGTQAQREQPNGADMVLDPHRRRDAVDDAARLWYGSFFGVLSTNSLAESGYPFGSVVPYCLDPQGHPLLLLSHLAQHCRNLQADRRCGFIVYQQAQGADVQQSRRLSCIADCHIDDNQAHLSRYCRHFPAGRTYAEQLGFRLYRLEPLRFHYNGGFATARWLGRERLSPAAAFAPDAEHLLLRRLAAERGTWLAAQGMADGSVEPVAIDAYGLTLRGTTGLIRLQSATLLTGWDGLAASIDAGLLRPAPFSTVANELTQKTTELKG